MTLQTVEEILLTSNKSENLGTIKNFSLINLGNSIIVVHIIKLVVLIYFMDRNIILKHQMFIQLGSLYRI